MSFATIQEAWDGDLPSVQIEKDDYDSNKKTKKYENNITLDYGYKPPKDYYDFDYEDDEEKILCEDILQHVESCESCRKKLIKSYPYNVPDNILNTLIFIIFGIFILFLIDIFVKLGKYLNTGLP